MAIKRYKRKNMEGKLPMRRVRFESFDLWVNQHQAYVSASPKLVIPELPITLLRSSTICFYDNAYFTFLFIRESELPLGPGDDGLARGSPLTSASPFAAIFPAGSVTRLLPPSGDDRIEEVRVALGRWNSTISLTLRDGVQRHPALAAALRRALTIRVRKRSS